MKRFVEWAGGPNARLLVISWATESPQESFDYFVEQVRPLGPASIEPAPFAPLTPEKRAAFLSQLEAATGVFFTGGDTEARAWPLRRGESALDAAATIHTDIARGFIRCEVIRWGDLVELGSRAEVARRGLQRLEGKEYVVEDGDVLNIRFNI